MNYLFFAAGVFIVAFVLVNVFISTLAPRGSRFFTQRLLHWVWKFFYWLADGKGSRKVMNYAGIFTLIIFLLAWVFLFWFGNTLIYASQLDSVVSTANNMPATPIEKFYFVGYILSTLGLGDFGPNGNGWMVYTSFISFSGFIMISTIVSYLLSVSAGEIQKRKVSCFIHSLGSSPEKILLNAWNGHDFSRITNNFTELTNLILEVSQQHTAYPVLHNFHSNLISESFSVNLADLDEALTILLLYKPEELLPSKFEIYSLRYAITEFLATLQKAHIHQSKNNPCPLEIEKLLKEQIPLKDNSEKIDLNIEQLKFRRKLLLGMLENDGWNMQSIYAGKKLYQEYDF
ncbi:MAG: hypothetical protein ACTHK8_09050 [Ginsengibacter sp.]